MPPGRNKKVTREKMTIVTIPWQVTSLYQNIGNNSGSLRESHLSKWGYQTLDKLRVPSVFGGDAIADVKCRVSKAVWCQGAACYTKKTADFAEMSQIIHADGRAYGACRACEQKGQCSYSAAHTSGNRVACFFVTATAVPMFVDMKLIGGDVNTLCLGHAALL